MGVSHLLFVDDNIIFCGVEPVNLQSLHYVLFFFVAVIGLKVNLGKSKLVPVGDVQGTDGMAQPCGKFNLELDLL